MSRFPMGTRLLGLLFAFACALTVGCSNSGGSSNIPSNSIVTIAIGAVSAVVPFSAGAISGTISVPAVPQAPSGDAVSVLASLTPIASQPTLQSKAIRAASQSAPPQNVTIVYLGVTFSKTTVLPSGLGFIIALPPSVNPNAGPLYLGFFDPSGSGGWQLGAFGPGTVSGSHLTFTTPANAATYQSGLQYGFVLYQIVSAGPTPSTSPSSGVPTPSTSPSSGVPTPTPNGLFAAPSSIQISGTGSSNARPLLVQESGYSGAITENDNCSGIATVSPTSGNGPQVNITVTGVAAGSCTATFSDTHGQHSSVSINVTTASFGIN